MSVFLYILPTRRKPSSLAASRLWSTDTSADDRWQLFASHAVQQSHPPADNEDQENAGTSNQPERHNDILLIASCPTESGSLFSHFVFLDFGLASTSVAITLGHDSIAILDIGGELEDTRTVGSAVIGSGLAVVFRGETGWDCAFEDLGGEEWRGGFDGA